MMRRNVASLTAALIGVGLLSGCASSSVQRVGGNSYAPTSPSSVVTVFTDEKEIKQPYEVVGIISYDNPGKYQVLNLGDAIPSLQEKAREVGANGIIIDQTMPVKSGLISTGIFVQARAVRINQ